MQILFIDESYNMASQEPFFALGGIVVPENSWIECKNKIKEIKKKNNIVGELKWRWVFNKKAKTNSMLNLSIDSRLNNVVKPLLEFIKLEKGLQLFTTLTYINDLKKEFIKQEKIEENSPVFKEKFECYCYHQNYENMVRRFQYFLQDYNKTNGNEKGIVICDGRNRQEDEALRQLHKEMLCGTTSKRTINYSHLIEHVLIAPSHFSIGIQFADIVAGVIYNKLIQNKRTDFLFEIIKDKFNTFTKRGKKVTEGRGILKLPKISEYWKNRDKQ